MIEICRSGGIVRRWRRRTLLRFLIVAFFSVVGISLGTAYAGTSSDLLITYPVSGNPLNVTVAAPGDIWYTLPEEGKIGRLEVTPAGLVSTVQYMLPTADSQPYDIAYGNGAVWFTERDANRIGKIDVVTGEITEYLIPAADSQPTGIDLDPSGLVWFVTFASNHLGRFDPKTEAFEMFAYERDGAQFEDVSARVKNEIWLTAPGVSRSISFDEASRRFLEVNPLPLDSLPFNIVVSESGLPWITDQGREELAFFLPGTGDIWLSLQYSNYGAHPVGIDHSTVGNLERVWFTDDQFDLVGQIVLRGNSGYIPPFFGVDNPAGIVVDDEENAWIAVAGGITVWHPPYWNSIYLPVIFR